MIGDGGIHAYRANRLLRRRPTSPNDAFSSYARSPGGGRVRYIAVADRRIARRSTLRRYIRLGRLR